MSSDASLSGVQKDFEKTVNAMQAHADEEVSSDYANSILVLPTLFDAKLIFGELKPFLRPGVDWHTVVTIPWVQAKMLIYYLTVTVAAHELDNGSINIPSQLMPPEPPPPPTPESQNPAVWDFYRFLKEYRQNFIKDFTQKTE